MDPPTEKRASPLAALELGLSAVPGSTYEHQLASNGRWALSEGSRHFDEKSAVFATLHAITRRLDELQISYAVVGAMALFRHGLRRFTEYVHILVTRQDLKLIHESLAGRGYLPLHKSSKHLRDAESKVRIEFFTTGDYPGDGKPKPVAFPDPQRVAEESNSINYVNLPTLVEMKLASGMTGAGRLKDLADVMELIKILNLPADFAQQLHPYVREKFNELCKQSAKRYVALWDKKWLAPYAKTLDDMIDALRREGVAVERDESGRDDRARLVTTDPDVAKKYDMVEESEFWNTSDDDVRD